MIKYKRNIERSTIELAWEFGMTTRKFDLFPGGECCLFTSLFNIIGELFPGTDGDIERWYPFVTPLISSKPEKKR